MSSRSSNSPGPRFLSVGRVKGHRGASGELTVKVFGADAGIWVSADRVWIRREGPGPGRCYEIEHARAYKDRLVVKLRGLDDANVAAGLRGHEVFVARGDLAELPEGEHYGEELIGLNVHDEGGRKLGRVSGILKTGGTDLLLVDQEKQDPADEPGEALMIPLAREYVTGILEEQGRIEVRLPAGFEALNRHEP